METDHTSPNVTVPVEVPVNGDYTIKVRYANGNGPVNTENKCAIRAVFVDGKRIGTVVMPHRGRGNWNDWGLSNSVTLPLTAGEHTVTLQLTPDTENMNIATNHALVDQVILTKK